MSRRSTTLLLFFATIVSHRLQAADACPPIAAAPSSRVLYLGPVSAEYSDVLAVRAQLVDEAARPLSGRTLTFSFSGASQPATTGVDGIASSTLPVTAAPGAVPLVMSFAGDATRNGSQTSATINVQRDDTQLALTNSPFLSSGDVKLTARLTHGGADHASLPVANRPIEFQLGTHTAVGSTDADGVAAATITVPATELGPSQILARFVGDTYYRESQDARSAFVYQRSSFVIWGGNTVKPVVGQTVNFWGHSWINQVVGGDYDKQADFKGYGAASSASELCQADAHLTVSPQLTPGCWDSKPGNSAPPAQLPRYISVIVSTAIGKSQDTIYGNIAAVAILEVATDPAYGDDPGKPGFGKIIAIVSDGANLFPRPIIASTVEQPESLLPGQSFTVRLTLNNRGSAAASALTVQSTFDGATPLAGAIDIPTLAAAESKTFAFDEKLAALTPRGPSETSEAYISRLAAEDGRNTTSTTATRFSDVSGAYFSPVLSFAASRLRLPILTLRVTGIGCALPGTIIPYTIEITNIGGAASSSGRLAVTFPDGTATELPVAALAPAASATLNTTWMVPVVPAKAATETDAAYRARLTSFDGRALTLNGSLTWTDALANQYGATSAQFVTVERLPILAITAAALPSSSSPGQILTAEFTIQNIGSAPSASGRVIVTLPDGSTTELQVVGLPSGGSTTLNTTWTVPVIAARGATESDVAYRARLSTFDGKNLTFTGTLSWSDSNANSYGGTSAQSQSIERIPIFVITANALPVSVSPSETVALAYSIQNVGSAASSAGRLVITLPDGTTSEVQVRGLAVATSTTLNATWSVPAITAKGATETDAAYRARLALIDGKKLTFTGSVTWTDSNTNSYGAMSAQSETTERLPILVLGAAVLPASVLPNESFTPAYTIQNVGSGTASSVALRVKLPDGVETTLPSVTIAGGTSVQLNASAYTVAAIAIRATGETDAAYQQRLATFDGKSLPVSATLNWTDALQAGYGPLSQDGATTEFVPILGIVMTAPAQAFSGDPVTYSITVTNSGHTMAQAVDLVFTMPDGSVQHPAVSNIAAASSASLTIVYTIPENQPEGNLTATAVLRWSDARANSYSDVSARSTTLAKPKNLAPVVNAGPDQIIALPATQIDNSVTLRPIATGFNQPIGIDYHAPSNKVLMSVNYISGLPYNLELIAADGSRTRFSAVAGLTEELKVATAKDDGNGVSRGGFPVGEVFTGSGVAGVIVRISADGTTVRNPWVTLPGETGLMRGSLYVDRTGIFGGDLIVVTTTGGVWRVTQTGQATRLASLGVHLEGLITLPNDSAKYGPWAGKIVIGAEEQGRFYTIDAQGASTIYTLGINPEDIDLIPANENFYGVDYSGQKLWGANASGFSSMVGDLIVVQESPGIMYHVRWNGTQFVKTELARVAQWEHVTFAPSGIVNVPAPGATATLNGTVTDDGKPVGAVVTQLWSKVSGPADVTFANRTSTSTTAIFNDPGTYILRLTATDTALTSFDEVTITVDPRNQPPVVNAGADQSIRLPNVASLSGSATDDGFPRGSTLSYTWSKVSGPGTTTFANANLAATTVSFSSSGSYILRLTVSDGNLFASDDVVIGVSPQNLAPVVNAGADQTITLPASAQLQGTANDDGLPAGSTLTFAWTQMSGPGVASFASPSALTTSVSFSAAGAYVLRLSANDSQFASADDVTITVQPGAAISLSPSVAGPNVVQTQQTLTAVLTSGGAPIANTAITFTVTGPNATTQSVTSGANGSASFTYTGTVNGTDSVQATAQIGGTSVASNTATVGWITPVESISTTTVLGRFFTADGEGVFNITPALQPVFSQRFPTINFNPPAGTVPGNTSNVGVLTHPFTDVTTDVNGNFTGLIIAQGGNAQAGTGPLLNFNAVFTGTLIIGSPGAVQFDFFTDDGFIFSVGNGATRVSGALSNPPANMRSPFENLPVMGAYNVLTAPVGNFVTVNFPSAGTYPFEVDYAEGHAGALSLTMTRSTANGNKGIPPTGTLTITPNTFPVLGVGTPVSITVSATDASGTPVAYLAVTLNITGANARQLTAITDSTGKAAFTYTAANTGGDYLQATASFTGMVGYSNTVNIQRGTNRAPTVDAGPDQTITLPKNVVTLSGTIADDGLPLNTPQTITWSTVSGPGAVVFGSPTRTDTTATFNVAGVYVLRLSVNDGNLATNDDITVTILSSVAGNSPPQVNAGADQTITAPSAAILNGTATDDGVPAGGGLAISWAKVSGPGTVSFADPTRLSTTTTFSSAGTYVLRLTASDTQLTASDDITIVVKPGNQAPVVNAGADQTISLTSTTLSGTATDDGQPNGTLTVSWSKVSGPGTVTLATPTALTTAVSFSAPGAYILRLTGNDSQLLGTDDVTITVTPPNQAPVVNAGTDQTINLPNAATLNGTATDDGLPIGSTLTKSWSRVSGPGTVTFANPNAAVTTATFSVAGDYTLRLTASDSLLSTSDDVRVVVYDAVTGPPPTVAITAPADGANVTAPVSIAGSVSGGSWRLESVLQSGDGTANSGWVTLATGTGAASGTLAQFDPTILLNGVYALRLTATDSSNQSSSAISSVVVSRDMKVGTFTLSFPDLDVPVAGIAMKVTRTYDSRDKRVGDFGVGWNLDLKNIRIQKSDILGKNWEETVQSGFLPRYCVERRKAHVVTVSFPDGKVFKFQAKTSPDCQQIDSIREANVVFEQVATTPSAAGATLTVADNFVFVVGSIPGAVELLESENLDPFNPTEFTLTTREGFVYVVNQQTGLRSMRDPAGNMLTINSNGIIHSSGKSITFVRDGVGRITRITDPSGNALVYTYNPSGDLATFEDREHGLSAYTYDGNHGLLSIRDPNGRMPVRNEFDSSGRLLRTIDADGNAINYTHSLAANQELITDRLGNNTLCEYDSNGNVLQKTDALGGVTRYTYDGTGNKLTETNPLGQTTTFTYDANGNATSETDPLGGVKRATFDANGRRLTTTDELGNITSYGYDAAGNLVRQEDALHNVTTYTYDSRGLRLTETNPVGCTTRFEYDGNGNLTRQTDALGRVVTYTYDSSGNRLTQTRTRTTPSGTESLVTSYQYDRENRLVKTTYPDGSFVQDAYDGAGQRMQHTDELGRNTEFEYNGAGDVVTTEYPDGLTERIGYDAEGHRTSTTDRAGRITSIGYDKLGRITSTTKADGAVTRNAYDAAGRLIEMTDPRGNHTTYVYDAAGRNTSITDPTGAVTRFTFDSAGNKTSVTDPNGNVTTFTYDGAGRLTKTTFADGTFKSTTYDAAGRKTAETDQAGAITRFEYDCASRLIKVTDALGQITSFAYDELGNRTSQTDAEGRRTASEFDKRGRMTRRTLPLGQFETRSYDAVGNVISSKDFNGATTSFTYDALNRQTQATLADGSTVAYAYTTAGKPERITDRRGITSYTYDAVDRELSINQPGAGTISYTYDASGNRTSVTTPAGTTAYAFDAANRLSTVTSPSGGVTRYVYDPAGHRMELRSANGTITAYTYDRLGRLTQLVNKRSDNSVLSSFAYTLGAAGNRTRVVEGSGRAVDYGYDAVYRLLSESVVDPVKGNSLTTWTYDKVGNRLTENRNGVLKTFIYDANDRLLSDGATYTYDANGNVLSKTAGADVATYQYDAASRLKRVSTSASTADYEYDASGNRVRKTVNGVAITNYLVDTAIENAQVLLETDGAGVPRASYVRGDDLLSMQRGPVQSFYLADGQMSTRQLTDAAQTVTDEYTFDAFGNLTAKTGSTENDFLYTGEQFDAGAGLYYLRARYYDPATGRFLSRDSFDGNVFEPQTLHKYAYAHNDPMNRRDPSGRFSLIEESTAIDVLSVLNNIFPTLLRGFIIYKGVDVFFKPGFEMRNYGMEMFTFCSSTACFEAAHKLVESGSALIVAGSKMIDWAEKTVGQVDAIMSLGKTGYGFYELAQAFRNAPSGVRSISFRYEYAAYLDYLEVTGRSYLHITASVRIKEVYLYMKIWTDYKDAIGKALKMLDKLRKLRGQIDKAGDLINFSEDDLGI